MNYTISVSGRGADASLYPLTLEQAQELLEMGIQEDLMSMDEISDYLGVDEIYSSADHCVVGAYWGEHYITVTNDETGEEVWNSEGDDDTDDTEWKDGGIEDSSYLVVEDYSKGEFFTFRLETEGEFDPIKLRPVISEVAEVRDLITGMIYDEVDISDSKEFGNYWSKGFYYIVYEKNW